jgi:DNA-binding transcriptional regulator YhcF (GntR family)
MKAKNGKPDNLPFSVSRASRTTLVAQVADGIRSCIASGFFREGDVIPTTRDLAALLGVSRIVTRAAVKALADDGLIIPRPRAGCVVLGRGEKLWRGNILFVQRTDGRVFYVNVFSAALRARLVRAGWLFTQVTAVPDRAGKPDLAELELHLTHPVSLAVTMFDNPPAERLLSKSGVPFVTLGNKATCRLSGCVGHVRYDRSAAADEVADAARQAGVKSVLEVGYESFDDVGAALKAVGIRTEYWVVDVANAGKMPAAAAFAARDTFAARLAESRKWLPDLIYFSDDYVCTGALAAFAAAGVRVPEDVKVATWSNLGNGPVFAKELTRVETDPEGDAGKVADALLAYLDNRHGAFSLTLGRTFRKGETL